MVGMCIRAPVIPGGRSSPLLALGVVVCVGLGACGASGHPRRGSPSTVTTVARPSTTVAGVEASGFRTVLSPIGLHVRAGPSTSAKILGTAAEGVALEVLGRSAAGGGWLKVRGATVTGWIDASPTLSAPGKFISFTSTFHNFAGLYPVSWTVAESRAAATFRSPAAARESIVVTTAANITKLGRVPIDYQEVRSEQIVTCGVTSELNTYRRSGAPPPTSASTGAIAQPYLAQIRLKLNPKHALGMEANVTDLSELQSLRDFANSVTFPYPQCEG